MRYVGRAVRAIVSVVIFALVLELCARVDDRISYGAPMWSSYNVDGLYEADHVGKRGKPNARYKKWQLNSLGFRGPELRPGTTRVVCFGASETFGLYEAEGQEYPRQLERDLNARAGGDVFQVVNVAYPGETVATAILRVPEIVETVHPRYAIIYPAPAEYIWLPWLDPPKSANNGVIEPLPKFELRIADRMRIVLKSVLPSRFQSRLRQHEIDRDEAQYKLMDRVPEENVFRFRADLLALIVALNARGLEPVLVTHADAFGEHPNAPDHNLLIAWRKFYPMLKEAGFIDMERRMNDVMRSIAPEENVVLVDAAREIPPTSEYFADFSHFTNAGSQLIAQKLAEGMKSAVGGGLHAASSPARVNAAMASNSE
jgi:lysophospholipase L1-like esterase